MPLSSPRATDEVDGCHRQIPVKGGTRLYQGALAMLAGGLAQPGAANPAAVALGRVEYGVDATAAPDGALTVLVRRGVFKFANAPADPVPAAQIGTPCFVVDDCTVGATAAPANGAPTRSPAGRVFQVDPDGVWVEIL